MGIGERVLLSLGVLSTLAASTPPTVAHADYAATCEFTLTITTQTGHQITTTPSSQTLTLNLQGTCATDRSSNLLVSLASTSGGTMVGANVSCETIQATGIAQFVWSVSSIISRSTTALADGPLAASAWTFVATGGPVIASAAMVWTSESEMAQCVESGVSHVHLVGTLVYDDVAASGPS